MSSSRTGYKPGFTLPLSSNVLMAQSPDSGISGEGGWALKSKGEFYPYIPPPKSRILQEIYTIPDKFILFGRFLFSMLSYQHIERAKVRSKCLSPGG